MEEDRILIDSHKPEHPCEAKQWQQHHRHFYTASGREKEKKRHHHIAGYFRLQRALSLVASRSHDIFLGSRRLGRFVELYSQAM